MNRRERIRKEVREAAAKKYRKLKRDQAQKRRDLNTAVLAYASVMIREAPDRKTANRDHRSTQAIDRFRSIENEASALARSPMTPSRLRTKYRSLALQAEASRSRMRSIRWNELSQRQKIANIGRAYDNMSRIIKSIITETQSEITGISTPELKFERAHSTLNQMTESIYQPGEQRSAREMSRIYSQASRSLRDMKESIKSLRD